MSLKSNKSNLSFLLNLIPRFQFAKKCEFWASFMAKSTWLEVICIMMTIQSDMLLASLLKLLIKISPTLWRHQSHHGAKNQGKFELFGYQHGQVLQI
jgi:hypothetical protein